MWKMKSKATILVNFNILNEVVLIAKMIYYLCVKYEESSILHARL